MHGLKAKDTDLIENKSKELLLCMRRIMDCILLYAQSIISFTKELFRV